MSQPPNQNAKPLKDLGGYVARNNRTNDRQPHWRGKVRVQGKEYLVSLWEKEGQPELMSMSLTDPETMPQRANPSSPSQKGPQASSSSAGTPSGGDDFGDLFGPLGD